MVKILALSHKYRTLQMRPFLNVALTTYKKRRVVVSARHRSVQIGKSFRSETGLEIKSTVHNTDSYSRNICSLATQRLSEHLANPSLLLTMGNVKIFP